MTTLVIVIVLLGHYIVPSFEKRFFPCRVNIFLTGFLSETGNINHM